MIKVKPTLAFISAQNAVQQALFKRVSEAVEPLIEPLQADILKISDSDNYSLQVDRIFRPLKDRLEGRLFPIAESSEWYIREMIESHLFDTQPIPDTAVEFAKSTMARSIYIFLRDSKALLVKQLLTFGRRATYYPLEVRRRGGGFSRSFFRGMSSYVSKRSSGETGRKLVDKGNFNGEINLSKIYDEELEKILKTTKTAEVNGNRFIRPIAGGPQYKTLNPAKTDFQTKGYALVQDKNELTYMELGE